MSPESLAAFAVGLALSLPAVWMAHEPVAGAICWRRGRPVEVTVLVVRHRYTGVASRVTRFRRWLAQLLDHVLLHGFWN